MPLRRAVLTRWTEAGHWDKKLQSVVTEPGYFEHSKSGLFKDELPDTKAR
jgi:hypothetical protein